MKRAMKRMIVFGGRCLALVALAPALAGAQQSWVEDFTRYTLPGYNGLSGSDQFGWVAYYGACLTAGANSGTYQDSSPIPPCVNNSNYTGKTSYGGTPNYNEIQYGGAYGYLGNSSAPSSQASQSPDPDQQGALRLTNGGPYYAEHGAIISTTPFSAANGVKIKFKAVSYIGDGSNGDGADGITFFMLDANAPTGWTGSWPPTVGSWGGSLGYTCSNSNSPYVGLTGGYIGLGIDEYGNFTNSGDNTATGPGQAPGEIGLRGNGSVSWPWLNFVNSTYYPSSLSSTLQTQAVLNTCKTGTLWNYSSGTGVNTGVSLPTGPNSGAATSTYNVAGEWQYGDYGYITRYVLPSGTKIAYENNDQATARTNAQPIDYTLQITGSQTNPPYQLSLTFSINGGAPQVVLNPTAIGGTNGVLPSSLYFGFAGSTGGSNNVHEILCFQADPANVSDSSASANMPLDRTIGAFQVFLPSYNTQNWWGDIVASALTTSTNGYSLVLSTNWDASCVLTGGTCPVSGGGTQTYSGLSSTQRTILTWNGSTGVPFEWSNITSAQQSALTAGDSTVTANRLNYLRGDRSNEINSVTGVGLYRYRTSLLGDIIHSGPYWQSAPSDDYPATWTDNLHSSATAPENSGPTYAAFTSTYAQRENFVYTGSNDGMLHAFEAGYFDANGNFQSSTNTGIEELAYMPGYVVNDIHSTTAQADYSNAQYGHEYYVDSGPRVDDLYYSGNWHSWLVGTLGAGGTGLYILDVTDPDGTQNSSLAFSEANASSIVIGEWNASTITCANVSNCGTHLGTVSGYPMIKRFHNGLWGIVFGNGYNSSSGTAGIYVMIVNSAGNYTFYYYDTGVGPSLDPLGKSRANGIAYVAPADIDGDNIVDYVYAGDYFGNLWRFDLTSTCATSSGSCTGWGLTKYGSSSIPSLFSTPYSSSAGNWQPISTRPLVLVNSGRVLVVFGTGVEVPFTISSGDTYASGTQALYGIWDYNMSAFDTASGLSLSYLSSTTTISTSNLVQQTVTEGTLYETATTNTVTWCTTSPCGSGTELGWYLDLPSSTEQIIYNPTLPSGILMVNTVIPSTIAKFSCTKPSTASGWTMALNPATGGAFTTSPFLNISTGAALTSGGSPVAGLAANGAGSIVSFTVNGHTYWVTGTMGAPNSSLQTANAANTGSVGGSVSSSGSSSSSSSSATTTNQTGYTAGSLKSPIAGSGKRITWTQLR